MRAEDAKKLADKANEAGDKKALETELPILIKQIKAAATKGGRSIEHFDSINANVCAELRKLGYRVTYAAGARYVEQELQSTFKTIINW